MVAWRRAGQGRERQRCASGTSHARRKSVTTAARQYRGPEQRRGANCRSADQGCAHLRWRVEWQASPSCGGLKSAIALTPSNTRPYWACPEGPCEAIIDPRPVRIAGGWRLPAGGPLLEGSGELGGYDPEDLQEAYRIPNTGGSTQTIALVDAYGYKTAESDLATYRAKYELGACTKANGCFKKVNETGEEGNYPEAVTTEEKEKEEGWEHEDALDLDMASAACPSCHLMLVEANSPSFSDLGPSVNTAASLGATEISNSYGAAEENTTLCGTTGCKEFSADYNHPGVVVIASAGDSDYNGPAGPSFPASSPYVVSVGGTALHRAFNSRGWSEEVWNEPVSEAGTDSGCSHFEPKPSWQTDAGCANRTDNDVAAVAACKTPVSTYGVTGWIVLCGTSASSPLFAGIEAHASEHVRSLGAEQFYTHPSSLFDVTLGNNVNTAEGSNGECSPPSTDEYLCHAEIGYDGPTGWGTPDGVPGESPGEGFTTVTNIQPDAGPEAGGTSVVISGTNLTGTKEVRFGSASASSFTVNSESSITAISPAGSGTVDVTVTTTSNTSPTSSVDRFNYRQGVAVAWGQNLSGQLGNGTTTNSDLPTEATGLSATTAIAAGGNDSLALLAGGTVMAWGENGEGGLGNGTTTNSDVPVEVPGLKEVTNIATSGQHSLALLKTGTVMAWGKNNDGQLGNGSKGGFSDVPVAVSGLKEVTAVAAGEQHSLALLQNGTVMAWGNNASGQLGNGTTTTSDVPVAVKTLKGATAVAAGNNHSLALLAGGTVMAWGVNSRGQLGNGTKTTSNVPVAVKELSGATAIAAASNFSLALLAGGTIGAWGDNESGQLGIEFGGTSDVPVEVTELSGATAIAAGGEASLPAAPASGHSEALMRGGTVKDWGGNSHGELGIGTEGENKSSRVPVEVIGLEGATAIAGGQFHSLALGALAPTVTSVQPSSGPEAGGTTVTIKGTNLAGATAVDFGSASASAVKVESPSEITAVDPVGSGTVDVTVIVPGGTSPTSSADRFTYIPTLKITTTSLPGGKVGTSYSQTVEASGGTTPYKWSLSSGSLPSGLNLSESSGTITGTPTEPGTASFTIEVTDSGTPTPQKATANLSITMTQSTLCGPTNSPGGQGTANVCNWYSTKEIVPAGKKEVIFMSAGFTNANLVQTSTLGAISCKTVDFGTIENPGGGGAGVGKIFGFGFYSCSAPKCESEAEEQFGEPGRATVTALNLPWDQSLAEDGTPDSVRDHIGVPFSGTFGSPSPGEVDVKVVCEVIATGKQVKAANFEGELEPEIGIATGPAPGLNGDPSEISFAGASSGALHSEVGGEGTYSGSVKYWQWFPWGSFEVW